MRLKDLAALHPCFAAGKPNNRGRIHLPVSPTCNIACRFCSRDRNANENRPGVTAEILSPAAALDVVRRSAALAPEITVVGVAGPGDALASDFALEAFRLVKAEFPELITCMSTNGLLLADRADEVLALVDTLTVTVNETEPDTLERLCAGVSYQGKWRAGADGARLLIEKQLEGIRKVTAGGLTVKVNTVLVPEINGAHIGAIARTVREAGASLYNLIPLLPQAELSGFPAPSCAEIDAARREAEKYITVFRHCQRCRADAIGVPGGKDYGGQIYLSRVALENTFSHG
jgi:nitrogen fixation protein NifB